jgi:enamine deaminase RidA (YjgF/YER057c/UK114 family)
MIGKYIIFTPGDRGNLSEEWRQCLKQIIYKRETGQRLIKLNIFADIPDFVTFLKLSREVSKTIHDAFGPQCPVINVTAHPPEKPWKVSVEAGYRNSDSSDILTKYYESTPYVVCTSDAGTELWAGGLGAGQFQSDTREAASAAFDQMKTILDAEGMSFNNVVRQWNFIGNILEMKNGFQNYQVFNEVRSEFYQKYRTVRGYPAATGIGMKSGGVIIDFCAVMPEGQVSITPVENPNQVNAYEYGQEVLKGSSDIGKPVKHPPQFERALLMAGQIQSTLFISGTASIIGQDTIGIDDVEKQTVITLDNLNRLADNKRLGRIITSNDTEWGKFILLRVYIKNQNDFKKVKSICQERLPGVPAIFIESDICRDNLLVEIEAEFLIES